MSTLTLVLIVGIALLVIASVAALVHAITHAEEGYEDSTGFHRKNPDQLGHSETMAKPVSTTVDTGNPWDQIEGATCPVNLCRFQPMTPGDYSAHQS